MSTPITQEELSKLKIIGDFIFPKQSDDSTDFKNFEETMSKLIPKENSNLEKAFEDISGSKEESLTFKKLIQSYIKTKPESEQKLGEEGSKLLTSLMTDIVQINPKVIEGSKKEAKDKIISSVSFAGKAFISQFEISADKDGLIKGFKITYDDSAKKKIYDEKDKSIQEKLKIPLEMVDEEEYETVKDKITVDNEYLFRDSIPIFFGTMDGTLTSFGIKLRSGHIDSMNEPKGKPFLIGKEGGQLHILKAITGENGVRSIEPNFKDTLRLNLKLKEITVDNLNDYLTKEGGIKTEEPKQEALLEEEVKMEEEDEEKKNKRLQGGSKRKEIPSEKKEETKPKENIAMKFKNMKSNLNKEISEEMEKVFEGEGEPLDEIKKAKFYYKQIKDGYVLGVENGYSVPLDVNLKVEGLEIVEPEEFRKETNKDFPLGPGERKAFYTTVIPNYEEDVTFTFGPPSTEEQN